MSRMTDTEIGTLLWHLELLQADDRLERSNLRANEVVIVRRAVAQIEAIGNKGACGRDDCQCVTNRPGFRGRYAAFVRDAGKDTDTPRCQAEVHVDRWGSQCERAGKRPALANRGGELMHYCTQHAKRIVQPATEPSRHHAVGGSGVRRPDVGDSGEFQVVKDVLDGDFS